ncbi:DUF11 domain-containing protein [Leucobacter coleopterorum]|uniref:DUF11 domain-containing protein n=1 Tax=Leucobacter coleopterorum TaxID=2714933 RepID=A0ABX6JY94_9MICO|nr:DUF11 domain-containing protein [Leucobacter coleopterorum]QIM17914.1 DUF11 domain-containing protein [Leucobacter coleopterorum]
MAVSDLVFTPSRSVAGAGTFDYSITPYFQGNYWVEIDIDGNGSYTDPVDRRIQQGADGSGAYETEFDGIDGEGNPIDECGQMRARIYYDRLGEIHVVQRDVEVRGGGIELIRQNGPGAPNDTIYWDDTQLDPNRQTTTPEPNGTAGIASTGGVHGWQRVAGAAPVSWGDARSIDDWTYVPITQGTGEIAIDGRCLSVTKTTDAISEAVQGDIATYTVSVANTGTGDYTEADPAIIVDDMTSLLDDATFNDDAVASDGSLTFADNKLTWTGPLPSGDTVTLTYSVTITNAGDHQMKNVVSVTPEQCLSGDARCTAITETPLPHIVPSKSSDPASGTTLAAGEELIYTLSFTNDGASAGPIDSTDDLTAVLDDADVTVEPVSDTSGITATRTGTSLRIIGDLAPNTTAHITYTVKVRGSSDRGDGQLRNILIPDDEVGGCTGTDCETQHKVGELDVWKTVDPASGTTVPAGEVLTYKLHFSNRGEAPMPVDHEDVLAGILDDADVTSAPVASDAALSASAITEGRFGVTGVLKPGQVVTVTYQVTVRADDARGDGVLANFLVPRGGDPVCDANNRTCTANPVGAVSVVKTSDPASGSAVTEGEQVTYTLTFMNTSPAGSSPAPVSFTDHMTDVLDDATFDGRPVSSAKSITASFADEKITINGELGQGETATVTYTVRVKSYVDQGNRRLGNVVAHTGMDPICVVGSKLCTQHDILSTTLSHTGGEGQMPIIVGATALFVLGSGAFVFARIRRRKTVQQLNNSTLLD